MAHAVFRQGSGRARVNAVRADMAGFQRALRAWFRAGKRDLPWRRTRDPYRIWISEIMLQQTRVAAAVPYYERFLKRFPTVRALAQARSEQVLRYWAGLGYYSRARNLHRAAREIVARRSGRFPRAYDAALRLPGVGRYTAAAVLSIAYDAPHAVLDGNVARVLARIEARCGDLRAPQPWSELQKSAQELLAPNKPGEWNQALMELGATVCTPRAPRCGSCPVSRWCAAYRLGIAESLPAVRRKRAPVKLRIAAAVLLDPRGRTLVVKSGAGKPAGADALFSRMWQFPAVEVGRNARAELARHLRSRFRVQAASLLPLAQARHTVTFREITLAPFLIPVERFPEIECARTPLLSRLANLAVSSATRKIASTALACTRSA